MPLVAPYLHFSQNHPGDMEGAKLTEMSSTTFHLIFINTYITPKIYTSTLTVGKNWGSAQQEEKNSS